MEEIETSRPTVYRTVSYEDVPEDWLLIRSPYPVMASLLLYLMVVILGPRLMKTRASIHLTVPLRVYNMLQVFLNIYIIYSVILYPEYISVFVNNICMLPDGPYFENGKLVMISYGWSFLLSKILDLLDTGFMVLRKKNSHITFLHVYHHAAMAVFTWYTFSYMSFYHSIPLGFINAFVHSVMYSYYFLATFPQLKKHLWWKRHLTKLQLAQFVVMLVYLSLIYILGCSISREFTYIWIFNIFVILLMFINFYLNAYFSKQTKVH